MNFRILNNFLLNDVKLENAALVLAIFGFMILFAAREVRSRVKEKQVAFFWPVFVSMAISYVIVSYLVRRLCFGPGERLLLQA